MDYLKTKNKKLFINNFDLKKIAKKHKTPFYIYSADQIKKNIKLVQSSLKKSNPLICYAVKANSNIQVIRELKKNNVGADVVSAGELKLALKAGISPKKIVFSGVGKTEDEIKFAIQKGILSINAESESEILSINKISKKLNKIVKIGIRINPDVNSRRVSRAFFISTLRIKASYPSRRDTIA